MKETARASTKAERHDYAAFAQRVGSLRECGWDVRQRDEVCGLPRISGPKLHAKDD
jgi:hypothetical protein